MERHMTTDVNTAAGAAENFGFEIRGLRVVTASCEIYHSHNQDGTFHG
jgi:hypothetical protein